MTNLLIPRFQLIADFIGNTQEIGYVFETDIPAYYEKFPANFKRLEWWEERKISELPEFILGDEKVLRAKWHFNNGVLFVSDLDNTSGFDYSFLPNKTSPATKEQYNNYINSKK